MAVTLPSRFPWWVLPIIAATTWVVSITSMLIYWATEGRPRYISQFPDQRLPFISDIAACDKTMERLFFIACVITTICLDIGFLADRWLRHRAIISKKDTWQQNLVVCTALVLMTTSTVGIILLNIFGTLKYPAVHRVMGLLFMIGIICTACYFIWEYIYLHIGRRGIFILRLSFWLKMGSILFNLCTFTIMVVIQFIVKAHHDIAVIAEWCAAPIFGLYILSHALDLKLAMQGYFEETPGDVEKRQRGATEESDSKIMEVKADNVSSIILKIKFESVKSQGPSSHK